MVLNYIIIAHKNPLQIKRLIDTLNGEDNYFYIHIDKNQNIKEFIDIIGFDEKIYFLSDSDRYHCCWGNSGMLRAIIRVIEIINEQKRQGYTVLLSGQCYPVKSNQFINDFFKKNYGVNYIKCSKLPNKWPNGGLNRIYDYAFFSSNKKGDFVIFPTLFSSRIKFFPVKKIISNPKYSITFLRNIGLLLKKRVLPMNMQPYGGSSWWALPFETISFISEYISKNPQIVSYFDYSQSPEEIFFQMMVKNNLDKMQFKTIEDTLTFDDWSRPEGPSPATLKENDFKLLTSIPHLYARKFDIYMDANILDLIDKHLMTEKTMSKLIRKLLLLSLLFLLLSFPIQWIIDRGLEKSNFCIHYNEWNDLFDSKINCDLLILGSSRAWSQISPKYLDTALNLNSYNLGLDGYDFQMTYFRFKTYLLYNKAPKVVLLVLDANLLDKRKDLYLYEQFIPYLNHSIIKEAVSHYEGLDSKDFYIPFYKYTHDRRLFICSLKWLFRKEFQSEKYKGFYAFDRKFRPTLYTKLCNNDTTLRGFHGNINKDSEKYLNDLARICKTKNIQLIFSYNPEFRFNDRIVYQHGWITEYYRSFAAKNDIPLFDYTDNDMCKDSAYFYNVTHINKKGTQLLNKFLVGDLKKVIHD